MVNISFLSDAQRPRRSLIELLHHTGIPPANPRNQGSMVNRQGCESVNLNRYQQNIHLRNSISQARITIPWLLYTKEPSEAAGFLRVAEPSMLPRLASRLSKVSNWLPASAQAFTIFGDLQIEFLAPRLATNPW